MSEEQFEELVADALDAIPPQFLAALDNIVVLVEAKHPTESLYGLYHGVALTNRTSDYAGHLPDTITIYREPILAHAQTVDEARRQVSVTVVHEIGHYFGIDDDQLEEWGWG